MTKFLGGTLVGAIVTYIVMYIIDDYTVVRTINNADLSRRRNENN